MRNLFVIANRETGRFRARFSGRSVIVMLLVALAAGAIFYLASQHGFSFNQGIYVIGASPDAPKIGDARITVEVMSYADGLQELQKGDIDAYLNGKNVLSRDDDRSRYTVEALSQYFQASELRRIANTYDLNRSFPLRIQVQKLDLLQENISMGGLAGLIGTPSTAPTMRPSSAPTATPSPASTAAPSYQPTTGGTATGTPAPTDNPQGNDDTGIRDSVDSLGNGAPGLSVGFIRNGDTLIPSLMEPPLPLAQIFVSFLYVVPFFFISIFFTGSFMDEKVSRRLNVLMSAPVTPFDVIVGKLLPYLALSLAIVSVISLAMGGDLLLTLAIMLPVAMFVFAIFLLVAIFYRTFKDQTFFSIAAISFVTAYLIFPALFAGVSEVSYISPLTLLVQMYQGQYFGLKEFAFAVIPMCAVFVGALTLAMRTFKEEFLVSYGPLYRKLGDALYLAMDRRHKLLSVAVISFSLVPVAFMAQLAIIALAANLPGPLILASVMLFSVLVEEIVKSAGIASLIDNGKAGSPMSILLLSLASAVGFFVAEKALLFISLGFVSQSLLMSTIANSGLLFLPLLAHFAFTSVVCLALARFGVRWYLPAVAAGSLLHFGYNMYLIGGLS